MLYIKNPYTLRTEESGGVVRYFVSFKNGQGAVQEIEISREIYNEFDEFRKHDKRQQNYFSNHIEHFDLTDEQLNKRAFRKSGNVEEAVIEKMRGEALRRAVAELPEKQRRRFTLYYWDELTYRELGKAEGCSPTAARNSVEIAKKKIRAKLKQFK